MRALVLAVTLTAAAAHAVDFKGDARFWAGTGADSNPRRDFTSAGVGTTWDVFFPVVVSTSASLFWERARLTGTYDAAVRHFVLFGLPNLQHEDTLIQSASLSGAYALGNYFDLGADFRVRDRRAFERAYSDLRAEASIAFVPDAKLEVKVRGGWHRFLYWNRFATSFYSGGGGVSASYRFDKRHSAFLLGDYESQTFNATQCIRFEGPNIGEFTCQVEPPPGRRSDAVISVAVGYTYRGPFQAMLQYAYLDSSSNSWGETQRRHRISGSLGVRLPWRFTLLATGALQMSSYPDGVFLSSDLVVLEDDENTNNLTVKLVYPLGPKVDVDAKFAVYYSRLARNDLNYLRFVGSLGFSWRL